MGRCIQIAGQPAQISIQLPGGVKIASMAHATQQIPNIMDPFQSLLQGVQPALGAIQPVFDIIGFVMQLMQCWITVLQLLGILLLPTNPLNPISAMFPPPPKPDPDTGEPLDPYEPWIEKVLTGVPECFLALIGKSLKLAGLVPQISVGVTIKDSVLTAMGLLDAAMAQVNGLADLFTGIPPATTGNFTFDLLLQCAADNSTTQLEHKLGPASNLVPLMSLITLMAEAATQPLPRVVFTMAEIAAEAGIPFFPDMQGVGGPSSEEQKEQYLGLIEDLTITGLPIEIPDFSDLSNIGDVLQDLEAQIRPVLPAIELVQSILNSLNKA